MKVVCDANIIIDFSKIRRLELLKDVFGTVVIPKEVKEELLAGKKEGLGDADIEKAIDDWILVEKVKDLFALENLRIHIEKGESASIILAFSS